VRPGVTGWAQVNGRNALSWEQRFEHDLWYVEHRSLALDLRILGLTLAKVLRREGISAADHATMEPFRGSASTAEPHQSGDSGESGESGRSGRSGEAGESGESYKGA
jgi:hypothetical protein